MRCTPRSASLSLAAAALLVSACAFDDGDPWATVDLSLSVGFDLPESRRDGERVKTAKNYAIAIDRLEVVVRVVSVELTSGGASDVFDPADPPPGFGLCHNGHCHADSGALVPYEEIAASLGGGAATATPISLMGDGATLDVLAGSAVGLQACPDGCAITQRGTLSSLVVQLERLSVGGTAFDTLTGADARLDAAGRAFDVTLERAALDPLTEILRVRVDHGASVDVRLDSLATLSATLFDTIDWATDADGALGDLIAAKYREDAALTSSISR